jgi:predicted ATPase
MQEVPMSAETPFLADRVGLVLDRLEIHGYKSIRSIDLSLKQLNVLVGANGSGKSNLVQVFDFLGYLVRAELQIGVRRAGGAGALLHHGRKVTSEITVSLSFGANKYEAHLGPSDDDNLYFLSEEVDYHNWRYTQPFQLHLGSGHVESKLQAEARSHPGKAAEWALSTMGSWRVYHFHDTSSGALVKQRGPVSDDKFLRSDAGNLAAFLFRLSQTDESSYRRIVQAVRSVAPFFDDFDLDPDRSSSDVIQLEWRHRDTDTYFNAHALSDGTLRFICLATLLMQPEPPSLIVIDEPELGLHPFAIAQLCDLLRSCGQQVLISTQSVSLLNQLEDLEDVIIVEQAGGESTAQRLELAAVETWLEDYSLGELWEKNLIGGRPVQR